MYAMLGNQIQGFLLPAEHPPTILPKIDPETMKIPLTHFSFVSLWERLIDIKSTFLRSCAKRTGWLQLSTA